MHWKYIFNTFKCLITQSRMIHIIEWYYTVQSIKVWHRWHEPNEPSKVAAAQCFAPRWVRHPDDSSDRCVLRADHPNHIIPDTIIEVEIDVVTATKELQFHVKELYIKTASFVAGDKEIAAVYTTRMQSPGSWIDDVRENAWPGSNIA